MTKNGPNVYNKLMLSMIEENRQRIIININDLQRSFPNRTKQLLTNLVEEENNLRKALHNFVTQNNHS